MPDFKINIAKGRSRYSRQWTNETMRWSDFARMCSEVKRTGETYQAYVTMPRDMQGRIKDVGGFVGAVLTDGQRRKRSVRERTMITLDYDDPEPADDMHAHPVWMNVWRLDCAALIYTTHKHTRTAPRFRICIPLATPVAPAHYPALAKYVARMIGTEGIDETTYETARLFYLPSAANDGDFFFDSVDKAPLDPAPLLAELVAEPELDLTERGEAPAASVGDFIDLADDPRAKGGVIGAFCSVYDIDAAIAAYLPEVYRPAGRGRYTYANGSTTGGLCVYQGVWAYSNHNTDPANTGHCLNAFDLVRVHRFGGSEAASVSAMMELAAADPAVQRLIHAEQSERSSRALAEIADEPETEAGTDERDGGPCDDPDDWEDGLERTKKGMIINNTRNAVYILEHHPDLRGRLWWNDFAERIIVAGGLPWDKRATEWRDKDSAFLRRLMESYNINGRDRVADALTIAVQRHRRHPVREYLKECERKGYDRPRLERLFVDFLGAEDNELTRAMTRKFFAAAVARIMEPGVKFDNCPVLVGPQGIGKSTILRIMAGDEWFSDSLSGMEGKEAMSELHGVWIIEIGELSAIRRSDIEAVKNFISRTSDIYRAAYARYTDKHPRQCVFCATTNHQHILQGEFNRRFWIIQTHPELCDIASSMDKLRTLRDSLWAEAVDFWRKGETLFLPADLEAQSIARQQAYSVDADDPLLSAVESFADALVPLDWDSWTLARRRAYFKDRDPLEANATIRRDRICAAEFICERLGRDMGDREYQALARRVYRAFEAMGWQKINVSRHAQALYGRQRAYERPEDDDDI